MPKIVNKDNLTPKEAQVVQEVVSGVPRIEAIEKVYNTDNPAQVGAEVFARPRVKAAVRAALKDLNITESKIISRFDQQATKGKNEAAKVRANENLAQLADLYPDRHLIDASESEIHINLNY